MNEKQIKKSDYLYGVPGSYFKQFKYEDALIEKIRLSSNIIHNLSNKIHGKYKPSREEYRELNIRLTDVMNAKEFNEALLNEMNGII